MELSDLVGKGYFPHEEIPPAFNTEKLGLKALEIYNNFENYKNQLSNRKQKKINKKETLCIQYTVPQVGLKRRIFGIPNPFHQIELSYVINSNWEFFEDIYSKSNISASIPIDDPEGKQAITTKYSFDLFKEKSIEASFNKKFELKMDIARYFPSIYTHSISWAMHGKNFIKQPENRRNYDYVGNLLDAICSKCQSGQTNGIPVGPDTSRIIAEMLNCNFDEQLQYKFGDIVGYRFRDDCNFYFSSYSEAELVFKCFETMLTDYGLNINEEKTTIKKIPYSFESEWSILLSNYKIRSSIQPLEGKSRLESRKIRISAQRRDIKNFISLSFKLANKNPKKSVIKFAIRKLGYTKILKKNWDLYEGLIYQMAIKEPVILPDLLKILLRYKNLVNNDKLKKFLITIFEEHIYKGHNFEIAWGLWIAKTFSVKIEDDLAKKIIKSQDDISIIIALDMINEGLISKSIDLNQLKSELTEENLFSEHWLLIYESVKKGWLNPVDPDLLQNSLYFSELYSEDIEFYDSSRQVDITDFKRSY